MIRLADASVTVASGRRILGPVTWEIPPGAVVLEGASRSGKTTLLKAIAGLVPLSSGYVEIDGVRVVPSDSVRLRQVRSRLGFVFQSDALFDSMDVLGNVMFPLTRRGIDRVAARERALAALDSVGLGGKESMSPGALSGGMKKRLGLARAIVAKPPILLADDPLAGLDPGTSAAMVELMLSLNSGGGTLLVAAADGEPFRKRGFMAVRIAGGLVEDVGRPDPAAVPAGS